MNKFDDLLAFVTVVDSGSFTAAAERLDMDKSAVSRRVSLLEQRLGVQLLRRTTRRLNLTDSGRSFYTHSARILSDLEEAESAVQQEHGELRGRLRIALPLSFGVQHMSRPIAEFSQQHPKVVFDLDLNDRRIDLLQEGIDLAIRIGKLADSTLIARPLFDARTVICGSAEYLRRHGTPATPDDLRDHPCLSYSNLADPDHWVYRDDEGRAQRVRVNTVMSVNSGDFLCSAASQGLGLVMQPTFIAYRAVMRQELTPVLVDYQWPLTPAYAVYPPTRHLTFRVRAFIDFLVDYFAGTPYWDKECLEC